MESIIDHEDGKYTVFYTPINPGMYSITVEFLGTFGGTQGPIRGSPFKFEVKSDSDPEVNQLDSGLLIESIQNDIAHFQDLCNQTKEGLSKKVYKKILK